MSDAVSATYCTLKVVAIAVTSANELLLTSTWITSSSPTSASADAIPLPPPAFTTVIYAIAEPVFVWLLQKTHIAPWIFLVNTPHHFWICEIAAAYLCQLAVRNIRTSETIESKSGQWNPQQSSSKKLQYHRLWQIGLGASIPVLSAAAANAAVLMFAYSIDDIMQEENAALLLLFGWWGMFFYLGSRYGDFRMVRLAQRWPLQERNGWKCMNGWLLCICMLFFTRSAVRILLGINAFPIISGIGSIELGQNVPCIVSWKDACAPAWLRLILIIAPLPLSWIGAVLLRRTMDDSRTVESSTSEPKYE